ncbi:MAG: hypothetical protein J5I92_00475 [Thiogranum sp.]|nr:hypothetical protein [Thiogranum sp.]
MLAWFVTATLTMVLWAGLWAGVDEIPSFLKFLFLVGVPALLALAVGYAGSRKHTK